MPVILTNKAADDWINPEIAETDDVLNFLKPYPAELMFKYPVSRDVGNVKNSYETLSRRYH